jgi:hypothetical protein
MRMETNVDEYILQAEYAASASDFVQSALLYQKVRIRELL